MPEKHFSMFDAFKVWWFITWRATLVILPLLILVNVALVYFGASAVVTNIAAWITLIAAVFVQVYFIKSAVNRDHRTFRLSAVECKDSFSTSETT